MEEIGKPHYNMLKRHLYRIWFNALPRKIGPSIQTVPSNVRVTDDSVSLKMNDVEFVLDLGKTLPKKNGRTVQVESSNNLLVIKDTGRKWIVDLAFRSTGWDGLVKNILQGKVLVSLDALKDNLTPIPLTTEIAQLPANIMFE